jgi:hypothetical protein
MQPLQRALPTPAVVVVIPRARGIEHALALPAADRQKGQRGINFVAFTRA